MDLPEFGTPLFLVGTAMRSSLHNPESRLRTSRLIRSLSRATGGQKRALDAPLEGGTEGRMRTELSAGRSATSEAAES